MKNKIAIVFVFIYCLVSVQCCFGAEIRQSMVNKGNKKNTIIFVPLDSRPITNEQTVDTVVRLGYKVLTPPEKYLGTKDFWGNPDELWNWLEETTETNKEQVIAVVLSCDSLMYGSLVGSRCHDYSNRTLVERVRRFVDYHNKFPKIKKYAYSSIMRTTRFTKTGVENKNYDDFGDKFFRYTVLLDKKELGLCSYEEKLELIKLRVNIPIEMLNGWMILRNRNFLVNRQLLVLAKYGFFDYLVFARDDNEIFSQTHRESRKLTKYAEKLDLNNFQNLAGLDEIGALMLLRAINEANNEKPSVYVKYNDGVGGKTVPMFSDESIEKTVKNQILCINGVVATSPENASLVLLVNTSVDGKFIRHYQMALKGDFEFLAKPVTDAQIKQKEIQEASAKKFVDIVNNFVEKGYPVAVADISHPNGSDDAVMNLFRVRRLLFRLRAYSGWNTATNSTGYALAQGIIGNKLSTKDRTELLLVRYIDDWLYQRIVRNIIINDLAKIGGRYIYDFKDKKEVIEEDVNDLMHTAIYNYLPVFDELDNVTFSNPWNRMFEISIRFNE